MVRSMCRLKCPVAVTSATGTLPPVWQVTASVRHSGSPPPVNHMVLATSSSSAQLARQVLPLSVDDLLVDLNRRQPGQSHLVTQRQRVPDTPEILAGGVRRPDPGRAHAILIRNEDQRSRDYTNVKDKYRPGHADYTYDAKYGFRDYRGGGRSSARETTVRVAAGVVAKKLIAEAFGGTVVGYVKQVGTVVAQVPEPEHVTLADVETFPDGTPNIVRCPDVPRAQEMIELIERVRKDQDSIGGVSEDRGQATYQPGLGEPVFDKLKADMAKALVQPAGSRRRRIRFRVLRARPSARQRAQRRVLRGRERHGYSQHSNAHQPPRRHAGRHLVRHADRRARGDQADEQFVAWKQHTVTSDGEEAKAIRTKGRHDLCLSATLRADWRSR